jgi:hypothetical protein
VQIGIFFEWELIFFISNGYTLGTAAMQKQMIAVEIMDAHNLLLHLFLSVVLDSYFFSN